MYNVSPSPVHKLNKSFPNVAQLLLIISIKRLLWAHILAPQLYYAVDSAIIEYLLLLLLFYSIEKHNRIVIITCIVAMVAMYGIYADSTENFACQ